MYIFLAFSTKKSYQKGEIFIIPRRSRYKHRPHSECQTQQFLQSFPTKEPQGAGIFFANLNSKEHTCKSNDLSPRKIRENHGKQMSVKSTPPFERWSKTHFLWHFSSDQESWLVLWGILSMVYRRSLDNWDVFHPLDLYKPTNRGELIAALPNAHAR